MRFSVILPAAHGGALLRKSIEAARALDWPAEEVEVVVAGAEDAQSAVAEAGPAGPTLHFVPCESPSRPARLNAACARATGNVLVFTDDDCQPAPDLLRRLAETLEAEPKAGIVGGVDELDPAGHTFDVALDSVFASFLCTGGCRTGSGAALGKYYPKLWNMAVLRSAADAATLEGGALFDVSLAVHEDVDLAHRIERAGWQIVFAPDMRAVHRRETTYRSVSRRNFVMAGICRARGLHGTIHRLAAAGLATVLTLGALAPWAPAVRLPLGILLAAYGVPLLAVGVQQARRRRCLPLVVLVPLLAASLHVARALGYLFARPETTLTWRT